MKCSTQAAIAIGVGYLLGRKKRLGAAVLVAGATAGLGGGGAGGGLLSRGVKAVASSGPAGKLAPQLGELADSVRDDLLEAGKAAVMSALTSRIDSLSDNLRDRATRLRDAPGTAGAAAGGERAQDEQDEDERYDGEDDTAGDHGSEAGEDRQQRASRADEDREGEDRQGEDREGEDRGEGQRGEDPVPRQSRRPAQRQRPTVTRSRR